MAAANELIVPDYLVTHTDRLSQNLARVDSLIDLHMFLVPLVQNLDERRPEIDDVLRSATVLLHASLEDFLRSISIAHLPRTERHHLKDIPLAGNFRNTKFDLGDLMAHSGKTVNDVIESSIDEWLYRQCFNNSTDVANALKRIGMDPSSCNTSFSSLDEMILRRHQIVHNADRPSHSSEIASEISAIKRDTVQKWRDAVQTFMQSVLYQLQFVVQSNQ